MGKTTASLLLLFATLFMALPARAEFYGMSDYDLDVDGVDGTPPYLLKGFTFVDYNIPGQDLVLGQSTGVVNVGDAAEFNMTKVDDFDLNSFAPRNGANPPHMETKNFGGSPTWQDTNGGKYDFFIFEIGNRDNGAKGGNDEFSVQPILPGGVLGSAVVVPATAFGPTVATEPAIQLRRVGANNTGQRIGGIAFKVTDLLDDKGKPLTNSSVIEGLRITSGGLDPSCICAVPGAPFASGPVPADGATMDKACLILQWSQGMNAVSEEVYLSSNRDDVANTAASALLSTVALPAAATCTPNTPYAGGLAPGVYYWGVVTNTSQGKVTGPIWSFTVISPAASDPLPVDGAIYVPGDADLRWSAGADAILHYVYFGTDANAVAAATEGGLPTADPQFDPGPLEKGKSYFWRVDEFDGKNTTQGAVWSFDTVPAGEGGLKAEYFPASDSFVNAAVQRVDPQLDFDWNQQAPDPALDRLHFSVRWQGEIHIPATGTYTFITRSNDGSRIYVNDRLVINDWGTHSVRDTPGTISLEVGSYPFVVEYFQSGGSAEIHVSWQSDLIPRQLIPPVALVPAVRARLVYPANKAVDVSQNPRLQWEAATPDASYRIFFGLDAAQVEQADENTAGVFQGEQEETAYPASLEPGKTCYWRIDQVIPNDPQSPIKGNVWSFTTAQFPVVEDFENYDNNDEGTDRIFDVWIDGYADDYTSSRSTVGYLLPPYAERTITHGGRQSMPLDYNNAEAPFFSEATRTFTPAQNWLKVAGRDQKALALWFRGIAPPGAFQYDAAQQRYTISSGGTGIAGIADGMRFVYKKLSGNGSITARVESLGHPDDWAVAAVTMRNSLDPGAAMVTSGVRATAQAFLRWREFQGGGIVGTIEAPAFPATIVIPHYIRLTRSGNTFESEHSSDGKTWETIGEPVIVSMANEVFVGLAVASNTPDAQGAVNEAVFSNVATTGTVNPTGAFASLKDIGISGNAAQPLYVSVQDSAGKTATVTHPGGPHAIVTNTWTEWLISLSDFGAQGVNLGAVRKLVIGVGDRANPTADGAGILYVDDVRLYDARFLAGGLEVGPIAAVEVTGDNGTVLTINGISVSDMILGTTTFAGAPKYADQPPALADDFNAGSSASSDDQAYLQTLFARPVSTIFLLEKGANDSGYLQALGADGLPGGGRLGFTKDAFLKTSYKFGGQTGGGIIITALSPVYGIRILPPDGGPLGVDPVCIAGVPAQ